MNFSSPTKSRPPRFLMTYQSRDEALNPDKYTSESAKKSKTSNTSTQFSVPTKLASKLGSSAKSFMSMQFQSGANSDKSPVRHLANTVPMQRKMTTNNTRWTFPFMNTADTLTKMPDNIASAKKDVHKRKPSGEISMPFRDYTYKTHDGYMVVGGKKYPIQPMAKKHLDDVPVEEESVVPEESQPVKKSTSSLPTFKVTYSADANKKADSDTDVVPDEFANDIKRNVLPDFKESASSPAKPSWES